MNKNKVFFLVFILLISGIPLLTVKAIPYNSWNNYKILNFNDGFEGLQVNFNVTYGYGDNGLNFNCKENFEDLRFFNYNDDALLSAWNETTVNKDYCEIWLKLGSSKNVTLRYNNPEATSYWDINAVFINIIENVILALPLDENTSTTLYDYSGYNNDAVFVNSPEWIEGKYNSGVHFNATNSDYVYINDSSELRLSDAVYSIEFWIKTNNTDARDIINKATAGGFWLVRAEADGRCRTQIYDLSNSISVYSEVDSINDGLWHHVVASVNNNISALMYIDNYETDDYLMLNYLSNVQPTNTVKIAKGDLSGGYIDMEIDEIKIYNKSLNSTQISDLYNYYGDSTIIEGSVCCRIWIDDMLIPIFGIEFSNQVNDAILIGILALVVAMCALLLIIMNKKK